MPPLNTEKLTQAKSLGFSDRQIAHLTGTTEDAIRAERKRIGLVPSYRLVDTCAAEFEAYTPYYYSTYDRGDDEVKGNPARKVMILGGGPNRIGQGIEFDYCCVHAAFALKEDGYETIMVNSNPETVSTDYDTSDKLFFEPLTLEDVLHIYEREKCWGAIAQFGGQTPLNLALSLQKNGVNIIGTSPQSIEIAEDRKLFAAILDKLKIPQPPNGLATNEAEALVASKRLGYPVLVRPSFVLGGGPNRLGQGIEFDYCCVHASFALREAGFETVMVNSNPETVSTDYDTSDRLYFEPLTLEDVLEIYQQEDCTGAIVQFGGQTPLNLATALKANGVNIIGTSPESIEIAEDRNLFVHVLNKLGLRQPANRIAMSEGEAITSAAEIGYPVLVRPSFVLGGRGMFILYSEDELKAVVRQVFDVMPGKPVLIDKFLEDAIELDVDCISDGETSVVGGMLEHIEYAGVHSGDAAMVMPPHTLSPAMLTTVREATYALARELKVIGLMNVQFAIKDHQLFVLEVNPRASRTVPFVAKAIGVPLAKLAAKVMTGLKLKDLGFTREQTPKHWCVKEAVFPFVRFPGATIALGPEMRSTGEVMGLDDDLGVAFAKAQAAAKPGLPQQGNVFLSVKDGDKARAVQIARDLESLGFTIISTSGTATTLADAGVKVKRVAKIAEGRPNTVDLIKNGQIQLVINTPGGMIPRRDENAIRSAAYAHNVCIMTTITGAAAAVEGIRALREKHVGVRPIQQYLGNVNVV